MVQQWSHKREVPSSILSRCASALCHGINLSKLSGQTNKPASTSRGKDLLAKIVYHIPVYKHNVNVLGGER